MQILSSTIDHVTGAITVTISYNVKGPFGDTTETNSFQLTPSEAATVTGDQASLLAATESHLTAIGFVEVLP